MVTTIKFGTDGWRGVIAEDHTFDNVRRSAQGFAGYLTETRQTVIVSHYKRFATEVLAATGFKI